MPRTALDYTHGVTEASKSVILELMTALHSYRDALVLVGGWVPYFLLQKYRRADNPFEHVGSVDIDVAVNPEIVNDKVYATIVEIIEERGYTPRKDRNGHIIQYSFERKINSPADGKEYIISVDFLSTQFEKQRRHREVQHDLRARTMRGCAVVFKHYEIYYLEGTLPDNGETSIEIKIANVVGCITTKGIALGERYEEKDAYDIYSIVANYKDGPRNVAEEIIPFMGDNLVTEGLENIKDRFKSIRADGPAWVANFIHPASVEEKERTMADAFMNIFEFIKILEEYR